MGSSGHDDFVPQSDWDEVPENYILSIQVPGFSKGQLRISCVLKSHIIRVQGERGPDEKGKWIRFNETYNIPQKCNVEKINAKWHDGTLIINFPKDTIIPPGTETKTQITQTQTQTQEEESSKGTQKTATHLPSSVPKPTQEDERLRGRQKAETKDKNNIPSGEGLSPKMDQSLDVPRPSTEKRAEEEEELQKINKKEMTDKKKEEELQNDKKKEMTEEKKERTYPDRKKEEEEEEEELQKSKKGIRKDESVGGGGGRVTAAATAEVMEKQQLLVKIGVAVVVILSLATYISYKFGSKTRD